MSLGDTVRDHLPFMNLHVQLQQLEDLLALAEHAIAAHAGSNDLIASRHWLGGSVDAGHLAGVYLAGGHSTLHGLAAVYVWASLEANVNTFMANWLVWCGDASRIEAVRKLKIELGTYDAMSHEERREYVLLKLSEQLKAPLKVGINRFESVLHELGLEGSVDREVAKTLYELSVVRNVIAHRAGVADRRFCEACPWFKLEVGDHLILTRAQIHAYIDAANEYATTLSIRAGEQYGKFSPEVAGEPPDT